MPAALTEQENCYDPNGSMDRKAVAKVGILTFPDYIHDTYIADGGWKEDTWNWIFDPGYTLVDLVNDIFSVAANAVSMIKDAATNFVNGVKTGLEFIGNAALKLILDGFVYVLQSLMDIIISLLDNLINLDITISQVANGYQINGIHLEIYREDTDMIIEIANNKLNLGNIIASNEIKAETLGILGGGALFGTDASMITILHKAAMYTFMLTLPLLKMFKNLGVLVGAFFVQLASQIYFFAGGTINGIRDTKNNLPDRETFKFLMMISYLSMAISSLVLMIDNKGLSKSYRTTRNFLTLSALIISSLGVVATNEPVSNVFGLYIDETFAGISSFLSNTRGIVKDRDRAFISLMHVIYYFVMFLITLSINP